MIRTTCPKCGREDAVADYLASLPILCNGCGTRVTIGEPIVTTPIFPPPVAPPPPPPKTVAPTTPGPSRGTARPVPPPPIEEPPLPLAEVPTELVQELDAVAPPVVELRPAPQPRPAKKAAVPPPDEPPFPLPLAGVGRRLLARFLFLLGLGMVFGLGVALLIFGGPALKRDLTKDPKLAAAVLAALPLIYLLVNAAMLARTGQDVGKRYAGIRIVNADGSKPNEKTALLMRDALTFVIGLTGVGLLYWLADLFSLFGKGGRCLHDRIAGTRVVRA